MLWSDLYSPFCYTSNAISLYLEYSCKLYCLVIWPHSTAVELWPGRWIIWFDNLTWYFVMYWPWHFVHILFFLKMQECGPRFTLKLRNLQHGTFDSKGGEYEWVHKVLFRDLGIEFTMFWDFLLFPSNLPCVAFDSSRRWTRAAGGFSCKPEILLQKKTSHFIMVIELFYSSTNMPNHICYWF